MSRRTCFLVAAAFVAGIAVGLFWSSPAPGLAQTKKDDKTPTLETLAADVSLLKGEAVDQAHVMTSVGYHFSNLWFAGQKKNWPLAEFYLNETKSHLRWAVRVKPIRKDSENRDFKLVDFLDPLEKGPFKDVQQAVKALDRTAFEKAYRATLEGCYACHKASVKSYLKPAIPSRPAEAILDFEPESAK
ncbi:MAG: hypothetical protein U0793_30455 [Gemmataceae bacterium]